MKSTISQIKKANKVLKIYGLKMTRIDDKTISCGVIDIFTEDNEILNTLNTVRHILSSKENFNEVKHMCYFY